MKKRGFTLAEVLITLGIVGVVAALTAPALVMSSRNEANAARLSTVVSNMENAFQTAIAQEGVDNLYGTSLWQTEIDASLSSDSDIKSFVGHLGQYLIINGYKKNQEDLYGGSSSNISTHNMSATGGVGDAELLDDDPLVIETKNGSAIFIRTHRNGANLATQKNDAINAGCTLYTKAADVYIDVNGKNGPNVFGRDIFFFMLGENGILYPHGGRDVSRVANSASNDTTKTWDADTPNVFSCKDSYGSGNFPGAGCTARVIAEGYKINY